MHACPKDTELRAWAHDAEAQGNHMVPIHRETLRAMATKLADADHAARNTRAAVAAWLRGAADNLEKGGSV